MRLERPTRRWPSGTRSPCRAAGSIQPSEGRSITSCAGPPRTAIRSAAWRCTSWKAMPRRWAARSWKGPCRGAPRSVVFTRWLSRIAAVGVGARPCGPAPGRGGGMDLFPQSLLVKCGMRPPGSHALPVGPDRVAPWRPHDAVNSFARAAAPRGRPRLAGGLLPRSARTSGVVAPRDSYGGQGGRPTSSRRVRGTRRCGRHGRRGDLAQW